MEEKMHSMKPRSLLLMVVLHFVAMYFLMYVMVNQVSNIIPNLNNIYMAVLMTAAMVIIEGFLMRSMYENKKALSIMMGGAAVILVGCFLFIRQQTFISDKEFLKSMIPHHAGAILMCEKANLQNPEIQELCQNIISSQQTEIDWMREKLNE